MTHTLNADGSAARDILALHPFEASDFIREKLGERALSTIVSDLNRALLNGSADEQDEARRALSRLGFADT